MFRVSLKSSELWSCNLKLFFQANNTFTTESVSKKKWQVRGDTISSEFDKNCFVKELEWTLPLQVFSEYFPGSSASWLTAREWCRLSLPVLHKHQAVEIRLWWIHEDKRQRDGTWTEKKTGIPYSTPGIFTNYSWRARVGYEMVDKQRST